MSKDKQTPPQEVFDDIKECCIRVLTNSDHFRDNPFDSVYERMETTENYSNNYMGLIQRFDRIHQYAILGLLKTSTLLYLQEVAKDRNNGLTGMPRQFDEWIEARTHPNNSPTSQVR